MTGAYQSAIHRLAETFKKKAASLAETNKPEATLFHGDEGHAYLMKFIQRKLEAEEWDDDDAAQISAAFFFLLTCDEESSDDEEDEGEEDLL